MKELKQPKAGDIWLCNEGAVLVFGVSDIWVDYLWQEKADRFECDNTTMKDWHKCFSYQSNIFDCEELKDEMPQDYQEIKEQQKVFEQGFTKNDPVNHPSHYTSHPSGIECITITQHHNFCIGNMIKYLWRAGLKSSDTELQDCKKALWYLKKHIENLGEK